MQKIKVCTESCFPKPNDRLWIDAELISYDVARLNEIPMILSFSLGDIVQFNPSDDNHIIGIIGKGMKSVGGTYQITGNNILDEANKAGIKVFLSRFGILINFITPVLFVMAVPLNMNNDRLQHFCEKCPVKFDLFIPVDGNL